VTYLFTRWCPSHEEGLDLLRRAAAEADVELELDAVEIRSDAEAEERRFAGSPTYIVGGRDIVEPDPRMPRRVDTCRAYVTREGSVRPLPDADLLVNALRSARPDHEETA
jgi:hypothetical protein